MVIPVSEAFVGPPVRFIVSTAFFCSLCLFSRFYDFKTSKNILSSFYFVGSLRPGLRVHLPNEPYVCFLKAPWSIANQEDFTPSSSWFGVLQIIRVL